MKIGVLADTHIPIQANDIPKKVYDILSDVDLIIHAGDVVNMDFLKRLKEIAEVKAVHGNMDSSEVRKALPDKEVLECNSFKIGVTHGSGPPIKQLESLKSYFNEKVNVIIFGHSHVPVNETINGILYFNPGSPTDTVFAPYKSVGILEINGTVSGTIIPLET
ncbi:metallophosphoesterase family protein [Candidatus Omnitrophota bacterium]